MPHNMVTDDCSCATAVKSYCTENVALTLCKEQNHVI